MTDNSTTVEALIRNAWEKDIDPVDVTKVLNDNEIDLSIEQVQYLYRTWNEQITQEEKEDLNYGDSYTTQ